MSRVFRSKCMTAITSFATAVSLIVLFFLLSHIVVKGFRVLTPMFLLSETRSFGAAGGILYQIIGSTLMVLVTGVLTIFFAVGTAVCYNEILRGRVKRVAGVLLSGLNGVPSIVYGLFGLIFFVHLLGTGISWFVGSIILSLMILPTVIVNAMQAMQRIPKQYRECSLALGHTKWHTIVHVVLPQSISGVITGLFVGLARAIGETAPIMFIATVFSGVKVPTSFLEPVTALPTHILTLAQQAADPRALANAWGAALTLIILVGIFSSVALFLRLRYREVSTT